MKSKFTIFIVLAVVALIVLVIVSRNLPPGNSAAGTISTETGVRDITRDGKTCKEYFRLRDSRVVKTECPP
jgi:hypothetical protein